MNVVLLFCLLTAAAAAPHYYRRHHHSRFQDDLQPFFQDDIFDTRSFWDGLQRELFSLDTILGDISKHFPTSVSTEGLEGDVYRITAQLPGFDTDDITVKGKRGYIMIQAVHKCGGGSENVYINMRPLPSYVNETGNWTYKDGVLKIEFPLIVNPDASTTEAVVTQAPAVSKEEMEPTNEEDKRDADVGVERGDVGGESELMTNEIPTGYGSRGVEATTYAVDLKDEYEFVPKRQVK